MTAQASGTVALKDLGPTKLYELAVLGESALSQLLGCEYFVVPGTQRTKTLAEPSRSGSEHLPWYVRRRSFDAGARLT